ncbi:penicillin-binding transpeptidase domain-containing protein [Laedolimicola intestinihominis]|uniref:Penicillin-binding transpeptidase domain-containing protein n=1 Tax=Laedolimicola intestinihominis TaxID=3133166 RepID=A0ABV1FLP0_9FIRM
MKRRTAFSALTLGLGLSLGLLAGCGKKTVQPEELLTEYIDLLNQGDYADMYDFLTKEAQETTDKETYVNRYKNIYGGIEASDVRIDIADEGDKKDEKAETQRVKYTLTMDTIAGELSFDTVAIFTQNEDGDYKMSWDSQDIFPNLYNEDTVKVVTTQAKRGNIYDRNQVELAREGIASSVGLVPGKLPEDRDGAIAQLSELLEISTEKIEKALSAGWVRDDTFVPLRTVAKDAMELKEKLLEIPGVMISDTKVRFYPFGEKAAQLTGYVQNITAEELEKRTGQGYNRNSIIGKAGAERIYEEQLRPKDGYTIEIRNQLGEVKDVVLEKPAEDGQDVKLTIDITLQQYLYQEMEGDEGCAVAMDPTTGAVRALVSTPAYDPNDFVMGYTASAWEALNSDESQPLYNRYLAAWTPGSSFKPVVAALGLTAGTLNPDEDVKNDGLKWQKDSSWGDYYVTTLVDYPVKNLENALVHSDNIYFAKAACALGEKDFMKGLDSLGFGEELPFDFAATASGYGSDGRIASETELADSGYGQGKILVNPIHLSSIYSALVNGGNMVKPYLLDGESATYWKEGVFTKEAADTVLADLYQVVEDSAGTAHAAQRDAFRMAGKTGTAELKISKDDTEGQELGWFVGMCVENTEKPLLITMMIEDVKGRGGSHYVIPKVMKGFDEYMK